MKEKIKQYWWILMVLLIIGGAFYWYEWRPSRAYVECNQKSEEWLKKHAEENPSGDAREAVDIYNFKYKNCLRGKGINK